MDIAQIGNPLMSQKWYTAFRKMRVRQPPKRVPAIVNSYIATEGVEHMASHLSRFGSALNPPYATLTNYHQRCRETPKTQELGLVAQQPYNSKGSRFLGLVTL